MYYYTHYHHFYYYYCFAVITNSSVPALTPFVFMNNIHISNITKTCPTDHVEKDTRKVFKKRLVPTHSILQVNTCSEKQSNPQNHIVDKNKDISL